MKTKFFITIGVCVVILPVIIWYASLIYCEALTVLHGEEVTDVYIGNDIPEYFVDGYTTAKVVSYSDSKALV